MNHITRNLVASGMVVLGVGAIVTGLVIRDRQDLGSAGGYFAQADEAQVGGLIASREGAEVPADKYFAEMVEKLKREYVDPISDDQKLATGSVRGMVASLNDPNSVFLDANEFAAHQRAIAGHYEGIGAELSLEDSRGPASTGQGPKGEGDTADAIAAGIDIPKLVVVGLTPNGPAAKAGIQIGDAVEYVDSRWVVQAEPIIALRVLVKEVQQKKASPEQLVQLRKELRPKFERLVLPLKAKDELTLGDTGTVEVTWLRGTTEVKTTLNKSKSDVSPFGPDTKGVVHLAFAPGDTAKLSDAVKGKTAITIDLRESPMGDFATMKACLAAVAPKGTYGELETERQGKNHPLAVVAGNDHGPKVTLLVDKSTRGSAEIFALALQSKGLAKLQGGPMAGHRLVVETVSLPDGSGYTLVTGTYRPPNEKAALKRPAKPQSVAALSGATEVDA